MSKDEIDQILDAILGLLLVGGAKPIRIGTLLLIPSQVNSVEIEGHSIFFGFYGGTAVSTTLAAAKETLGTGGRPDASVAADVAHAAGLGHGDLPHDSREPVWDPSIVTFDREEDLRWIAEVASVPGALAYGESKNAAAAAALQIAYGKVVEDRDNLLLVVTNAYLERDRLRSLFDGLSNQAKGKDGPVISKSWVVNSINEILSPESDGDDF